MSKRTLKNRFSVNDWKPSKTLRTLTHWLPCRPKPAVTSLGLSSTSDVITFDQNWHHLCSTSAGGEDLSSDAQIRVIGRMEPKMHKNAQKVEQKTQTTICCHYTRLLHGKNCPSRWAFLGSFLTASKPSRRSITAAKRKEKEKKEWRKKIPKIEKPKDIGHFLVQKLSRNFDFCACPSGNVAKHDASGKKTKLSSCKCIFDQIKRNLTEIQPKNHQNVQETPFSQKAPGVNGLKWISSQMNFDFRLAWTFFKVRKLVSSSAWSLILLTS